MSNVDLRELAIDRDPQSSSSGSTVGRRNIATRYVLPIAMIAGFWCLTVWAAWDFVFPAKRVLVVPVFSTTSSVQQEGTPLFQAAGWIEPRPTPIRVAALSPGVVKKLIVVEDQAVKAGDPIAELITDDAKLIHDRAVADLRLREAELREAEAKSAGAETRFKQPVHLTAALGEADAMLAKIDTLLKNLPFQTQRAEADFNAMRLDYEGKLAAKGVVAGVEIDIAESKSKAAESLVKELKNRIDSLKKEQLALRNRRNALQTQLELLADETREKDEALARISSAKARVTRAQVVVAEAKLQLDRMTVVAPIDGRVFRLIAHPGARIGSGMTQMAGHDGSTVVTMYRPSMLQVRVDVRFEDIPKVHLKQKVKINNPALEKPLTGEVLFVSSEADIQKNTLQVKVAIPNPPPVFKPEMLVDVTFLATSSGTDEKSTQQVNLFVLPQLVYQDSGQAYVWLADQSAGVARKTYVQLGAESSNGRREVTSGLTVTSRIISSSTDGLRDGARIHVANEDASLGVNVANSQ